MSLVGSADQFVLAYRHIRGGYDQVFRPLIEGLRHRFVDGVKASVAPAQVDQAAEVAAAVVDLNLEAHARAYLINAFLAALNWRMDAEPQFGLPNLGPEIAVQSLAWDTRRFLDYLGFERATGDALLVVETKRPRESLPRFKKAEPVGTYSEVIARGLLGERLIGDWNEWLTDLTDYVRSIEAKGGSLPRRVCITNGEWVILFLDTADSFSVGSTCDPARILVFEDEEAVVRRAGDIFRCLEYGRVLGGARPLEAGQVPHYLPLAEIERAMFGLRLSYMEEPGNYGVAPAIIVSPFVFLRSRVGVWFRVEWQAAWNDHRFPYDEKHLREHLEAVDRSGRQLLTQIETALGGALVLTSLSVHYADEDAFSQLPGVAENGRDRFVIATGNNTHYLLAEPTVVNCPYHDWQQAIAHSVAADDQVLLRSVDPRSFFVSRELHHCAHRLVATAKATAILETSRDACGRRSGDIGSAFCEIWRFEQYLCCRTCVFQEVCTKARVFRLPCEVAPA